MSMPQLLGLRLEVARIVLVLELAGPLLAMCVCVAVAVLLVRLRHGGQLSCKRLRLEAR
jgi:hypothetical protein